MDLFYQSMPQKWFSKDKSDFIPPEHIQKKFARLDAKTLRRRQKRIAEANESHSVEQANKIIAPVVSAED